jgi:hypothetical protein
MSLAEFCALLKMRELVDHSELPDALLTAEAVQCFNLARAATDHSTVVGPRLHVAPAQHLGESGELIFFDFFEAIARCAVRSTRVDADGASPAGMGERVAHFAAKLMGDEGAADALLSSPARRQQSVKPKPDESSDNASARMVR